MIRYRCPRCKAVLESHDSMRSKRDQCPDCGEQTVVPLHGTGQRAAIMLGISSVVMIMLVVVTSVAWQRDNSSASGNADSTGPKTDQGVAENNDGSIVAQPNPPSPTLAATAPSPAPTPRPTPAASLVEIVRNYKDRLEERPGVAKDITTAQRHSLISEANVAITGVPLRLKADVIDVSYAAPPLSKDPEVRAALVKIQGIFELQQRVFASPEENESYQKFEWSGDLSSIGCGHIVVTASKAEAEAITKRSVLVIDARCSSVRITEKDNCFFIYFVIDSVEIDGVPRKVGV